MTPLTADDLARLRENLFRAHSRDTRLYVEYADMLALLDMVGGLQRREEGWKQLVREALTDAGTIPTLIRDRDGTVLVWTRRPEATDEEGDDEGDDWYPLATARPDLAALLDQALTPQGGGEG